VIEMIRNANAALGEKPSAAFSSGVGRRWEVLGQILRDAHPVGDAVIVMEGANREAGDLPVHSGPL